MCDGNFTRASVDILPSLPRDPSERFVRKGVVVIACPPFDCPGGQAATILFSVSRISTAACPPGVEVGGSLTGVSNLIKKNEVFSFGNDFLECHWWVK